MEAPTFGRQQLVVCGLLDERVSELIPVEIGDKELRTDGLVQGGPHLDI